MERLASLAGANFEHVPYKGTAPALLGVMSGEIHMVPASAIFRRGGDENRQSARKSP